MEHESAQTVTAATKKDDLTPVQVRVLTYLLHGSTLTHAGEQAGVRRETVSRWLHRPGAFRTAYRAESARLLEVMRCRLDALHAVGVEEGAHDFRDGDTCGGHAIERLMIELAAVTARTRDRRLARAAVKAKVEAECAEQGIDW